MARVSGSNSSGSRIGGSHRSGSQAALGGVGRGSRNSNRVPIISSGYGSASKPKGRVRHGKTVQYSRRDRSGATKYIGTTNNPTNRVSQHRETGKLEPGDKVVVETRPIPRKSAERVESAKLRTYRQEHGHSPKHNVTKDGRFHQPRLI